VRAIGLCCQLARLPFLVLGTLATITIASLGRLLRRLKSRLIQTELDAQAETDRRRSVETVYTARLSALEKDMEGLRGSVMSGERAKRYAHIVEQRLGELQAAIAEFPMPIAIVREEDDLCIIETASTSLFSLSGCDSAAQPPFLEALGTLLTTDCSPVTRSNHPVVRASKGEVIQGELALWRASGRTQVVRLYAKSVMPDGLTALAIVPSTGLGIAQVN